MAKWRKALWERLTLRRETDRAGRGPLVLAFALPVLVMLFLFALRGIYPFGNRSFLRTDLYNQYAPFFAELWRKLRCGESLFYSWDIGIGSNFVALYAYYLASPTNFLVALAPGTHIIEFVSYLVVLKIGLSGLAFAWYLRRHFDTGGSYAPTAFGLLYALSGYMAAYSWNIMWLDCIILTPIVMLGLERLVRKGRGGLYGASLGLAILSNYYLSIMICLFVVLYFAVLLASAPRKCLTGKRLGAVFSRFALYSALAGGFAGALLLPEFYALQMTKSSTITWPAKVISYFPTLDVLSRHLINVDTELELLHWPNVYCGVVVLFLLPLYAVNRAIPWREKAAKLFLAAFLLIGFSNNVLNFVWHGLHYPDSLPARQSFLYIFLLLTMCFEALRRIEENSERQLWGCFWGAAVFLVLCEKLVEEDFLHYDGVLLAGMFLVLYGCIVCLYRRGRAMRVLAVVLGLVVVSVEATVNMADTGVGTTSRDAYLSDWEGTQKLLASLEREDSGFYRVEKFSRRTKNDGAWLGYHGASLFSSVNNCHMADFYKAVGMMGSKSSYAFFGATPLTSALLSVKYTLSTEPLREPLREFIEEADGVYLYANKYVLPLGFMLPPAAQEWTPETDDPVFNQNQFAQLLGASGEMLQFMPCEVTDNRAVFEAGQDGYYYFHMGEMEQDSVTLSVEDGTGVTERRFSQTDREYLIDTGFVRTGSIVTLTVKEASTITPRLFRLQERSVAEALETLQRGTLTVDSYDSTHIRGHIDAPQGGKMVLSVPQEDGWRLWVDGQEAQTARFAGAFLCVELAGGRHEIFLSYRPRGFTAGLLVSIGSALLFAGISVYIGFFRKRWSRRPFKCIFGAFGL